MIKQAVNTLTDWLQVQDEFDKRDPAMNDSTMKQWQGIDLTLTSIPNQEPLKQTVLIPDHEDGYCRR
jgi:hypothetical protein